MATRLAFRTPLALAFGAFGLLLIVIGVILEIHPPEESPVWAAVAQSGLPAELGVAIGLIGFVAWAEQRLIKEANNAADRAISGAKIAVLEGLNEWERAEALHPDAISEAIADERTRRERSSLEALDALKKVASFDAIANVILTHRANYISEVRDLGWLDEQFVVRTSDDPQCHTLRFAVPQAWSPPPAGYANTASADSMLVALVDPRDLSRSPTVETGSYISVSWPRQRTLPAVAVDIEDQITSSGMSLYGFDFAFAYQELIKSVEVMFHGRTEDPSSNAYIQGSRLKVRINDNWIWTNHGLEAVGSRHAYEVKVPASVSPFIHAYRGSRPPEGDDARGWEEAVAWFENRVGYRVILRPPRNP